MLKPKQWPEITDILQRHGHNEAVIRGILDENFMRVAQQTWK